MNAQIQMDCTKCHRMMPVDNPAEPVAHDVCPPPPETVTLPVTGAVVPVAAAALTVKITGSMKGREGEAFTAEVRDGKRLLGTIENHGYGGGTDFHHADREAWDLWAAMVDDYAAISEDHRWVAHESFANDLYEEVGLARDLNRKRNAVVMLDGNRDEIFGINSPLDDSVRAWARRTYEGRNPMVWVKKTGWVEA